MKNCILCNKIVSQIASRNDAFRKKLKILFCKDCELLYQLTESSQQRLLNEYYSSQYFNKLKESKFFYTLKFLFSRIRSLSQYKYIMGEINNKDCGSVLEVGSANGVFLNVFKKRGWEVRGLEYNDFMIKKALKTFGIQLEKKEVFDINPEEGRFDVIVFSHVLEHLLNPVEVLRHCRKLLKPGGVVFIELPHHSLYSRIVKKELCARFKVPHIFYFRPKSLVRLVLKSGLRVRCVDRFFYSVPAFGGSGGLVGRVLNNIDFSSFSVFKVFVLLVSVLNLFLRFLCGFDSMERVGLVSEWRGFGDNIRLIAGKGCEF